MKEDKIERKLHLLLNEPFSIDSLEYCEYDESWYLKDEYRDELTLKILQIVKPKKKEK